MSGPMQIDMDGFAGSRSTIAIVTDYTDPEMSEWTRTLVDEYLTSPWINTVCGYGCTCAPRCALCRSLPAHTDRTTTTPVFV